MAHRKGGFRSAELGLVLAVGTKPPGGVVADVRRVGRSGYRGVDRRIEARPVLRDLDEGVFEAGKVDEVLEVVRVLEDVPGAHVVRASLELVQRMVLFVLLDEPEPELPEECVPAREEERGLVGLTLGPTLCGTGGHKRHGVPDDLLFGGFPVLRERLRKQPGVGPDLVKEGPAVLAVTVEDDRGVRPEDRFRSRSNIFK